MPTPQSTPTHPFMVPLTVLLANRVLLAVKV
jgi:hypothetical protein